MQVFREIAPGDMSWIAESVARWYSRERREFLESERLVARDGDTTISRFVSPRSGRAVTIATQYRSGARVALSCDCPSFRYRRRCKHIAAVVWAYHRYAVR